MDLSVVIVNYRTRDDVLELLASLLPELEGLEAECVVVDNDPAGGTGAALAGRFPAVRSIDNRENLGYARAVNQGLRATTGAFVMVMNPDCQVRPGAVRALLGLLRARPRAAMAGPRIEGPDGALEYSARRFPGPMAFLFNRYSLLTRLFPGNRFSRGYLMSDWDHASVREVDWLSGACLMVRRAAIDQVGPMDEAFFLFNEDVDWCRRMVLAGWSNVYVPDAVVVHRVGASRGKVANRVILERHRGMIHYFHKHHPAHPLVRALADGFILARAGVLMAANTLRR
jgi:GT2 family glycosyltransferase